MASPVGQKWSYEPMNQTELGEGTDPITVNVRQDKGPFGNLSVRITGVNKDGLDAPEGPWGARGPLWFFVRLLVFITCVTLLSTRGWATGGAHTIEVVAKVDQFADVSESVFLERTEIGLVSTCFKGWSSSALIGPLDGEVCGYTYYRWPNDTWLAALIFGIIFVVILSFRLTLELTELVNPGVLPITMQHPTLQGILRHLSWICMLLTWALFLGGYNTREFDAITMDLNETTSLGWGFNLWVTLWLLWMLK
eukprot:gene5592-8514_t